MLCVDHRSGWPEAVFLRKPTATKVNVFSKKSVPRFRKLGENFPYPGSSFHLCRIQDLRVTYLIQSFEFPLGNHSGIGTIQRGIRADRLVVSERTNTELSGIFF